MLTSNDNLLQYILDNIATKEDRDQLDKIIATNKQIANQVLFNPSITEKEKKDLTAQVKRNNERGNEIRLDLIERFARSGDFDAKAVYENALHVLHEKEKPSYKKEWLDSLSSLAAMLDDELGARNPMRSNLLEPAQFDNRDDFTNHLKQDIYNHIRLLDLADCPEYIASIKELISRIAFEAYKEREFSRLPNSPISNSLQSILAAGLDKAGELPARNGLVNTASQIKAVSILATSGKFEYTSSNGDRLELVIAGSESLRGSNKSTRMLFDLFYIRTNEQAINSEGEFIRRPLAAADGTTISVPFVEIDLQEMVDLKMVSSIKAARLLFSRSKELMVNFRVCGSMYCGQKRKVFTSGTLQQLFINVALINDKIRFQINDFLPREVYNPFITLIPNYAFSLSNNGYTLLRHIYVIGRQNADKITTSSKFVLSIRDIQKVLNLKSEKKQDKDNKIVYDSNASHNIKEPILKAIEEIEEAQKTARLSDISFLFTPESLPDLPVKEFLNGKLEITFNDNGVTNKYFRSLPKQPKKSRKKKN